MSSQVKLKNENGGTTIISSGTQSGDVSTEVSIVVDTINDFPTTAYDGMVCIVKDLDRGGTFIYDSSEVANDNQGTNFNGWMRQYSGAVHVKWFGAVGDGVTDDTVAIQNAIDTYPNEVVFPRGYTFGITDSLHIGRFSINGSGDVLGYCCTKGIKFSGIEKGDLNTPNVKWIGANQPGTNKVTQSDSLGSYDFVTDDKAMFEVVGSTGIEFDNLYLDGDNKAYSCIRLQGNSKLFTMNNCRLKNVRVGFRNGQAWDYETSTAYFGYANSPYFKANVYNAPAVGGWQGDTLTIGTSHIMGEKAGFSSESGQNLLQEISGSELYAGNGGQCYSSIGGRSVLTAIGFNKLTSGSPQSDIRFITGTNQIDVTQMHSESSATYNFMGSTIATNDKISIEGSDSTNIYLPGGGGYVDISNSTGVTLTRTSANAPLVCNIDSSEIVSPYIVLNTGSYDDLVTINTHAIKCAVTDFITGAGAVKAKGNISIGDVQIRTSENLYQNDLGALTLSKAQKTNLLVSTDGYTTRFSGKAPSLPDETSTQVVKFKTANSESRAINMNVFYTSGVSPYMVAVNDVISFVITRDSGGVVTTSSVTKIASTTVVDGYTSITTSYSLSVSGDYVILSITQNNETYDTPVSCSFEGTVMGGYGGGGTSTTYIEPI